jgi:predicted Zn-dependent peptidase
MRSVLDDPGELASYLGLAELTGTARTPGERERQLQQVTEEAVREAAQRVFRPSELSVAAVGELNATQRRALERAVRGFGG